MDLNTQARILQLAEGEDRRRKLVVLLGSPDPESAELAAMTLTSGDPTFAGPLAGVQLGLSVYHVLEAEVEEALDADTYRDQVALMASVLDTEAITKTMTAIRAGG